MLYSKITSDLPILSNTNFKDWKALVKLYCAQKACLGYLNTNKAATATPDQLELWTEKNKMVAGVLVRYMGSNNWAWFITDKNEEQAHTL